jgi:xanthine dehydrogenase YagR molybdenum-binding subunit
MRECLTKGAARFGWARRTPEPRSMRDRHYLIGQGMAAAIYTHWRWPGKARVTINGNGSALVEAAAHDIGTGTYTVMAKVAADVLDLAADKVNVRLGDTRLPESRPVGVQSVFGFSLGSVVVGHLGSAGGADTARPRTTNLAKHLLQVCYILLKVGEHAGAVCGRF